MSNLTSIEEGTLEKLLKMGSGNVLDFTDLEFERLFIRHGIDIDESRYQMLGTNNAKKLNICWKMERVEVVVSVLSDILGYCKAARELKKIDIDESLLDSSISIVDRLRKMSANFDGMGNLNFSKLPNIEKLPIGQPYIDVIKQRLNEAIVGLKTGAYLSTIVMSGSALECLLLGVADNNREIFHNCPKCPKTKGGSSKNFGNWRLMELIDVACEVRLLKPNIKSFSHGLRDFRNYIHPQKQMKENFRPDEDTAKICLQVLIIAVQAVE